MNLPLILIGGTVGYFLLSKKKSSTPTKQIVNENPVNGFVYNCDVIKVTDAEKMHWYIFNLVKNIIGKYGIEEITKNPNGFKLKDLFYKSLQKINPKCYDNFINNKTTGFERISILILFEMIDDQFRNYFIQSNYGIIYNYGVDSLSELEIKDKELYNAYIYFSKTFLVPQFNEIKQSLEPITKEDWNKFKEVTGYENI